LVASCVTNIHTKNYQNPITFVQVTIENVGDVFETQCIANEFLFVYVAALPCVRMISDKSHGNRALAAVGREQLFHPLFQQPSQAVELFAAVL